MNDLATTRRDIRLYEFDPFVLDMDDTTDNRLLRYGQPYELSDKPFSLLCILVKDPGREFTKEELVNRLWPEDKVKPNELAPVNRSKISPGNRRKLQTDEEYLAEIRKSGIRNKLQRQIAILRQRIGSDKIKTTKTGYCFVAHVEERQIGRIDEYADLKFDKWMFQDPQGRLITISICAGILFSALYFVVYLILGNEALPKPIVVFSLLQSVMIALALIVSRHIFDPDVKDYSEYDSPWVMKTCGYHDPDKWKSAKAGAKVALNRYAVFWKFLLGSWFFLYLLLFLTTYLDSPEKGHQVKLLYVLYITVTAFNNCNSLMITLCFIILNNPTAYGSEKGQRELDVSLTKIKRWGGITIGLFALVELLLIFVVQTEWPPLIKNNQIIMRADVISGIVGGITLALFIGRVQSRFLGPSVWLPSAFYLYAVIQPLFMFIKDFIRGESIIEAAFILKGLLYLYVAWLFQSGRLLFYFVRVKSIFERVNLDWKAFLSILR